MVRNVSFAALGDAHLAAQSVAEAGIAAGARLLSSLRHLLSPANDLDIFFMDDVIYCTHFACIGH